MIKKPTQAMSSNSSNTAKADKRIELLFARFAAIYGHVWRSQFKDEDYFLPFAKKEWMEALADFSDSVIDEVIVRCRNFYELPPTLPQVLKCCRSVQERIAYKPPVQPEAVSPEIRAHHAKQFRELLTSLQGKQFNFTSPIRGETHLEFSHFSLIRSP